jgi:hypothetical protein
LLNAAASSIVNPREGCNIATEQALMSARART